LMFSSVRRPRPRRRFSVLPSRSVRFSNIWISPDEWNSHWNRPAGDPRKDGGFYQSCETLTTGGVKPAVDRRPVLFASTQYWHYGGCSDACVSIARPPDVLMTLFMTTFLGLSSILLYLTASLLVGCRLISDHCSGPLVRNGLAGAAALAVCLHGILLYQGILTEEGMNLGLFNAASLVSWVVVLFLILAAVTKPLENLGIFVLPLAAITILLTLVYPREHVLPEDAGPGVTAHIVFSILAASLLTIAACQALLLAFQERRLRQKRPGLVMKVLPPLQTQESLLFQMIGVGFFLLSLSLVSGMMFLQDMFAQHLVHKTILSLFAWVVFAILLWGRWRHGWRGRTATRWSLAGFLVLMLAYFGSKLVLELILGRSWY
jgi:ABC-type uncharacterized transport system permease subunit